MIDYPKEYAETWHHTKEGKMESNHYWRIDSGNWRGRPRVLLLQKINELVLTSIKPPWCNRYSVAIEEEDERTFGIRVRLM